MFCVVNTRSRFQKRILVAKSTKHQENTKNPNLRVPCDDSAALDAEDGGGGGGGEALGTDSEEEEGKGAKHTNRSQDLLLVPIALRSNSGPIWFLC